MSFSYATGVITQANAAGKSITAVADGGSNELDLTVTSHGYVAGDLVQVTGTTSYNGVYVVSSSVSANVVAIPDTTVDGTQNAFGSTETGTIALGDKDLSGLSGLTGVTTTTIGIRTLYSVADGTRIDFTGACQWDPDAEFLEKIGTDFDSGSPGGSAEIYNTGDVFIGKILGTNADGSTRYSSGNGLVMTGSTATSLVRMTFFTDTGGSLIFLGGQVRFEGQIGQADTGIIKCYETLFVSTNPTRNIQACRNVGNANTVEFYNCRFDGIDYATNIFSINGMSTFSGEFLRGSVQNRGGTHNAAITFSNLTFAANFADGDWDCFGNAADDQAQATELTNVDVGTGLRVGFSAGGAREGHCAIFQEIEIVVKDENGSVLQGVDVVVNSTDNGNQVNANRPDATGKFQNSRTFTTGAFDTYTATTNASGETGTLTILTGRKWSDDATTTVSLDLYSKTNTAGTDDFDFDFYSYLHTPKTTEYILQSSTKITAIEVIITDALITETTQATVDAYTTIDDAFELYDRAESYRTTNKTSKTALVSRSGSQIVLAAVDLVINASAASAFAYSGTGSGTITIDSNTFTGGATSTTGTVTTQNGTLLSGGTFDCDVNYESGAGTTITNITVTSGHTLDFNTAGTYTLDGCTIDTLTNSSGGAVTVRAINSTITTNTGPSITIEYYSEINLTVKEGATPQSGAIVGYFDDTNTDRTYSSSFVNGALTSNGSGNVTGYALYRTDGTTYTGMNLYVGLAGYSRLAIPSTLTGADVTSDLLITSDSFYTATPSTGTTITWASLLITQAGNATTQGVYDYFIQQWFTASNIYRDQILTGQGAGFEISNSSTVTLSSGTLSGGALSIASGSTINANGGLLSCGANVVGTLNSANITVLSGTINMQGGTMDLADLTSEQVSGSFASGTIDLDSLSTPTATQLDLRSVTSLGSGLTVKNDSNENITVKILPSQTSPTLDVTGPGTGTLTVDSSVTVANSNILVDSYCRLYNVTQDHELDLQTLAGAGYSYDVSIGTGAGLAEVGDTLRLDVALYRTDGTVYLPLTEQTVLGNTGATFTGSQSVWTILQTIHAKGTAFEGANVTGFTLDVPNIEVDISVTEISGWKLATWLYYQTATTTDGIRNYFDSFDSLNLLNFEIDTTKVNLKVDNTGSPATWVDAAWTRSDAASIVASTSATIQFANGLINVVTAEGSTADLVDAFFAEAIEGSETFAESVRLMRAEAAGKVAVSGNTVTFRDAADSKDRITATTDSNGQRTAVTTDGT